MATAGYDPKKAETFNKLRQSGLSEDQAWTQAGLTDNDIATYVINDVPYNDDGTKNTNRGQIGPHIVGSGTQTIPYTAAEKAESDAYYNSLGETKNVERVAYPVKADSQPSNKTPVTYTTTSTEQVSGGGSTTIITPQPTANEKSSAIQAQADAKNAELKKFQADNPINPNATPEEKAARREQIKQLAGERDKLASQAEEAKTPGTPSEVTVPNTTTNTSTTTYQTSSTNTPVQSVGGPDPATNQTPTAPNTPIVLQTGYTANVTGKEIALATNEKNLAGREANQQQLLDNANSFSRSEQQRLDAEAAAAAARGDPDAAAKRAEAEKYATDRANATDAAAKNQQLIDADKQLIAQQQGEVAQAKAQAAANPVPPGYVVATAGDDPANNPQPPVVADQTATPASYSAAPVEPGSLAETQNNVLNTVQANPVSTPGAVPDTPANTGVFANPNYSPEAVTGTPAPVNLATDPGAKSPFGGAASNAAAARNPEAAAAAYQQEQANQAAAMKRKAQEEGAVQAEFQAPANGDWRVRLRLAPSAKYLYMDDNNTLLKPLKASNGVVFPYMPTIQTTYNANYESVELTHSNYRGQFYKSSYVGDVQITGTFTAQDTAEANYLLAVIHFFRSVTKMFYGAKDPLRGAPPPLVYLIGLGQYQFNNQPCVVKTFNYSMPNDCDYIRTKPNNYNTNLGGRSPKPQAANDPISSVVSRLKNALLPQGAVPAVPAQGLLEMQSVTNIADSTYVPTKCEIQLTLMPIQTRSQQSQQFSMEAFANGNLLKGGFW